MATKQLRRIVIVGGGTSGWMTAAALGRFLEAGWSVTLVESDEIGTIGVGEATIPMVRNFNQSLGIPEAPFMAATQGTYKLGIQFEGWGAFDDSYIHAFGLVGRGLGLLPFQHYWLRGRAEGVAGPLSDYVLNALAAGANRFAHVERKADSALPPMPYAYHFDATLYAQFLRRFAEERGVTRREGRIVEVLRDAESGDVSAVRLADGGMVEGDLFVDCSGFRSLLLGETLGVGYQDWSQWLGCDRAVAVPSARAEPLVPYTRSIAQKAGWRWRIPLQHRTGNGHVFSTRFMDDAEAEKILLANIDGEQLADPFKVDFKAGKRKQLWHKNCVAIGLAGGFLEPLESTSLHLVQSGIVRLMRLLPDGGFNQANIDEFNRQTDFEFERIRDFIILHYKATERADSPFWDHCRTMEVPATLQRKIDLWMANARIFREDEELFAEESWIQVFLGQGMVPRGYDPMVRIKSDVQINQFLSNIRLVIGKCVDVMPSHGEYVAKTCPAAA